MSSAPTVGSLKERFSALRTLRPFIAMVWRASPPLMATSLALRLVRALVPVVALYVGKLIIDDVVRVVQMPGRPTTLDGCWRAASCSGWESCCRPSSRSPCCRTCSSASSPWSMDFCPRR
jgi:ATP-binding cassette, subfamily B, bacterial